MNTEPTTPPAWPADSNAYTMAELEQQYVAERAFFRERLVHDPKAGVLHLLFAADYEVPLGGITEPAHLLRWVAHLAEFIRKVCAIKGWNPYGG